MNGLVVVLVVVVLAWALANQGNNDDEDNERGRWNTLGRNHPDRHKVTPAIGRKGWGKGR
jgi:hypothetical protein